MVASNNLYSRFVTGLKIVLPLAALALLSTMFLLARDPAESPTIPYSELRDIARDPRITEPYFAGIADDGSVISIAAEEVRPARDRPDGFSIAHIRAEIEATDGTRIEIEAGEGHVDSRAKIATLGGRARLTTSSGYVIQTDGLTANLGSGRIESTGPISIEAPYGEIAARSLVIRISEYGTGQQMVFNGGVRLLYTPGN